VSNFRKIVKIVHESHPLQRVSNVKRLSSYDERRTTKSNAPQTIIIHEGSVPRLSVDRTGGHGEWRNTHTLPIFNEKGMHNASSSEQASFAYKVSILALGKIIEVSSNSSFGPL
jgi:hypothetical protein